MLNVCAQVVYKFYVACGQVGGVILRLFEGPLWLWITCGLFDGLYTICTRLYTQALGSVVSVGTSLYTVFTGLTKTTTIQINYS